MEDLVTDALLPSVKEVCWSLSWVGEALEDEPPYHFLFRLSKSRSDFLAEHLLLDFPID